MNETKCLLFGLGAGLAAGLLLAPRSGVKTRQLLVKAANEGQARATAHGVVAAVEEGREQLVG